jgi:hypothetical protein
MSSGTSRCTTPHTVKVAVQSAAYVRATELSWMYLLLAACDLLVHSARATAPNPANGQ